MTKYRIIFTSDLTKHYDYELTDVAYQKYLEMENEGKVFIIPLTVYGTYLNTPMEDTITQMEIQKKQASYVPEVKPPNFPTEVYNYLTITPQYIDPSSLLYQQALDAQQLLTQQEFDATSTMIDAIQVVGGVQERPTDTDNTYIANGVESTYCTTCNLEQFLKEAGYSVNDLNRNSSDPFWDIFFDTKYSNFREIVKEREILLDAGIKADLDLTSAESFNTYLNKLPTYRAELDDIKKNERQQPSFSLESLLGSFSSSPTVNDTQTNLLGGNQQQITTQDSITTQQQIVRDPLGSSLSIGSGLAIGLGVLVVGSLLNKRK